MGEKSKQIKYLKDYKPSAYLVLHVDVDVDFAPERMVITCRLSIERAPETEPGAALELDGEELELVSLKIDGQELKDKQFTYANDKLVVHNPPAQRFVLESRVAVKPEENSQLMGLYRSNDIWCTQCEPEGFRRITFMADRPDIMATYRVRLTADKAQAPVLLANGNLVESGEAGAGRHYAIWDDPHPKPTYLFAVVGGDLDVLNDKFTTMSGKDIALAIYCEPGKTARCAYAMEALKRSMRWDEERFGREYDLSVFNIVAVSDFNFGAMENKGLNIFNDKYILADPDIATDMDYYNIERIVAHEYFHNWTGNRVTCRDWFQLCLKEGLTVYRDQEFTSDIRSRAVKRIGDARDLRAHQFPEDAGPLAHPPRPDQYAEINNFYTSTVYNKGAEVVRMLATLLGKDEFRKGCDLYFERHDGEATTIESWLKVFEDSSGRNLGQFSRWYTQAGTPEVTYQGEWSEGDKTYRLKLSQNTKPTPGQPEKEPQVIPLKFGLVGPNGQDMGWSAVSGNAVVGDMIVFGTSQTELTFEGVSAKPVLSLLRGFSAPVNLSGDQSTEEQFFLARHDADPFNRWQALQSVGLDMMVEAVRNGGEFDPVNIARLSEALSDTLESDALDSAFKALALSLPGEGSIAMVLANNIDPAKIHEVRRDLLKQVSSGMSGHLLDAYENLKSEAPASQDMQQVRARSLRNQCLGLLVAQEEAQFDALARSQYERADNMSDRMGALGAITMRWGDDAPDIVEDFGARFGKDVLVYDKWLRLMARAPDEGCLDRVKAIYGASDFPKTNPNRLKALVGAFAMGNPAQFTRSDGAGFEFVAEVANEVDSANPQLSSALMTSFRSWRTWEANRRNLAGKVLKRMEKQEGKSPDLSDILARTLAG